jgi:NADPH:quinone reductase-like Zn-dependent oxidoreductase
VFAAGGKGVSAVFDGVGASTFQTSLKVLDYLGSLVSFGNASGKVWRLCALLLCDDCAASKVVHAQVFA